jgi:hypothetical protein
MNNVPEFDPYKLLLKRKQHQEDPTSIPNIQYNQDDVKELEQFCQKHGILGVNFKNMNPKSILNMLKSKMGIVDNHSMNNSIKKMLYG